MRENTRLEEGHFTSNSKSLRIDRGQEREKANGEEKSDKVKELFGIHLRADCPLALVRMPGSGVHEGEEEEDDDDDDDDHHHHCERPSDIRQVANCCLEMNSSGGKEIGDDKQTGEGSLGRRSQPKRQHD